MPLMTDAGDDVSSSLSSLSLCVIVPADHGCSVCVVRCIDIRRQFQRAVGFSVQLAGGILQASGVLLITVSGV